MGKFVKENKSIISKIAVFALILLVAIVSVVKVSKKNTAGLDVETKRAQNYDQLVDDRAQYIDGEGTEIGSCEYVKFAAFYPKDLDNDGFAEKVLGSCKEIGTSDTLYVDIGVEQQGYLKNATISLQGSNVAYSMNNLKDSVLAEDCVFYNRTSKTISLKKLDPNQGELLYVTTSANVTNPYAYTAPYSDAEEHIDIPANKIILNGTYVDSDENEHAIRKVIELTNDWYGEARAEFSGLNNTIEYNAYLGKEDKSIEFSFTFSEIYEKLIPQNAHIELDIAELAGEYPVDVLCENGEYNEGRHKLIIDNDSKESSETYHVKLVYSDEVYDEITNDISYASYKMVMPVSGYYLCYNNQNEEFSNPYQTQRVDSKVYVNFNINNNTDADYGINGYFLGGQYVQEPNSTKYKKVMSKNPILAAYDTEDEVDNMEYLVEWYATRQRVTSSEQVGVTIKDQRPVENAPYGDTLAGTYLEEYAKIKEIYFSNSAFIPSDGYVDVFDNDTNDLIKRFSYAEIERFNTRENAYVLDGDVKHIRVETSRLNADLNTKLSVVQVKEINVAKIKEDFPRRTQIERMEELKTTIHGTLTNSAAAASADIAYLETEKNYASITLTPKMASVAEPLHEVITINVPSSNTIYSQWKNGIFLIEIPEKIVNMTVNSITATKVNVVGNELSEQDGKKYLKIITNNDTPTSGFSITIDCDMNINQTASSGNIPFYLYAYNENCNINYYSSSDRYDINGNGNTSEVILSERAYLGLSAASTFITQENLTNYDETTNSEITVAPNIANVLSGTRTATVNVEIVNNHTQRLEDIIILGKIPFEGNRFIDGVDLGSKFSTTMKDGGIRVPEELKRYTTVYYTSNENPTNDVTLSSNGWTLAENLSSFDNVKCYLIDLDGFALNSQYGYEFSYDVNIPEDVAFNDTAYSCHIVYYNLVTDEGKIESSKQPSKLGMRIVSYYDIELDKVKENTSHAIQGATYQVTEVLPASADESLPAETKLAISGNDGKIIFRNLRINQEYKIKEIKAPGNYELSDKEITFKLEQKENGDLEFISDEDFDDDIAITEVAGQKAIVKSKVEDTPKIELDLTKLDENNEPLGGVVYTINGKRIGTNPRGKIIVDGLSFGVTNTIKESYAKGYYLDDTEYEFTVNKDARNNITVTSTKEEFRNAIIENSDTADLVKVAVALTNEKIPTYNLKLVKVDESNTFVKLEDARFLIRKVDDGNSVFISTNNNGEATLDNLYQYVEGKNITGRYVLQEFEAPVGYTKNDEEITFHVEKDENDDLQVVFEEGSGETVYSAEFDNNTLVITIKDRPMFKIRKVDVETRNPLANAQFAIYQVDEQGNIGDFAKDVNGDYIGAQNENGYWVVTTNEQGYLTAPLPNGTYKVIEVKAPTGYALYTGAEIIRIADGNRWDIKYVPPRKVNAIYKIEDLVDFSNSVNNGEQYEGETVLLMNDLDFTSDESYNNPNSDYGDINGDGVNEGLKAELTKRNTSCKGFTPIGNLTSSFKGEFDGQGHKLDNIYINTSESRAGLFGSTSYAVIKNFGINSGVLICLSTAEYKYIGGIVGYADETDIRNCYNKAVISVGNDTRYYFYVGGIAGFGQKSIENCYNRGNIQISSLNQSELHVGGISGYSSNTTIKNVYNTGIVTYTDSRYPHVYPISYGTINNSYYYDNGNSRYTDTSNSTLKTYAEMNTAEFVTLLGDSNWKLDEDSENNGFPVLKLNSSSDSNELVTEIYSIDDLVELSNQVNSGVDYTGITVTLMNDLDFTNDSDYKEDSTIKAGLIDVNGDGFTPIGNSTNMFKGTFNGQNHKISNLYISSTAGYIGLFGMIQNAEILNLNVSGEIRNKDNTGGLYMGGICGLANYSKLSFCGSEVKLYDENTNTNIMVGGIAGLLPNSEVRNCYNKGNIKCKIGNSCYIGGITGPTGNIYDCYNRGNIEVENSAANAYISGVACTSVNNSYNTGNITYDNSAGGNVGYVTLNGLAVNSYYLDSAQISANYNDNSVAKDSTSMKSAEFVNLLGVNWMLDTANTNDGYPIIGRVANINKIEDLVKLSKQVKGGLSYSGLEVKLNETLDFNENSSYRNPGDISFGDINEDGNVSGIKDELTNENGKGFDPIGEYFSNNHSFTGIFNGQNKEIKNLYINRDDYAGLFGSIKDATIKNLTVSGKIKGGSETGGICGYAQSNARIENCNNYCNILSSSSNLGGILGEFSTNYTDQNLNIINCNNYGTINGNSDLGGIIGDNNSMKTTITNCNNYGDITGSSNVGGILGYLEYGGKKLIVDNCKNTGKIESSESGGILGKVYGNVIVKNSSNEGVIVSSSPSYLGGIVGCSYSGSSDGNLSIFNCNNSGKIYGTNNDHSAYFGGIVGKSSETMQISYSYNTADIGDSEYSTYAAAGIIGYSNANNTVENCYNLGNIYNARYTGGIGGYVDYSAIKNSYNKGNITINISESRNNTYVGGIAAYNPSATVVYSYNSGIINCADNTSTMYIGGITGYGSTAYSFNKANIIANRLSSSYVGGVIGYGNYAHNSYNTGNITVNDSSSWTYCGGVAGDVNSTTSYCYNDGDISLTTNNYNSNNYYIGGVVSYGSNGVTAYCYNTGNIKTEIDASSIYIGGVSGYSNSSTTYSYNTGNITNKTDAENTTYVTIGGINGNGGAVSHAYNTGDITNEVIGNHRGVMVGGIRGYSTNAINNVYNTGNVVNISNMSLDGYYTYTGPITGYEVSGNKRYYLDAIEVVGPNQLIQNQDIAVSDEELKSDEIYEQIRVSSDNSVCENWRKVDGGYPILDIPVYAESNESAVEIEVEDKKLEFNITAEIGENINGVRAGGDVSGVYNEKYTSSLHRKFVETVDYGNNSTEPIVITPDTGYQVANVLIEGEKYTFDADANGIVTIPAGYFTNITKNINVVATFAPIEEILVINKEDENHNPVSGAVFEVHQVEDREEPTGVVGNIVNDGEEQTYNTYLENDITSTAVKYRSNYGNYPFNQQADGSFISGNAGQHNSLAGSYLVIDLRDKTGDCKISLGYELSSESSDYGMIYVKDNVTSLDTDKSGTMLLYRGGINSNDNCECTVSGGSIYYLHFAYKKDYSVNTGNDCLIVKNIKVYELTPEEHTVGPFYFENINGKYVSNNPEQIPITTYATSVIPVDLTGKTGKYNIIVNNEIYGNNHSGSIFVNKSSTRKTGYNTSTGDILIANKYGTSSAENNSAVVEGGDIYYIHLVHCNYSNTSNPLLDNTFTINSVNVTLNTDDFINVTGIVTNESGKANVNVQYGKYEIYETTAPEGYTKSDEHKTHVIGEGTTNSLTFVNETKKKVISHYYLKNTGAEYDTEPVKVSEDEEYFGDLNEEYSTHVYQQIDDYSLVKDNEGEYVLPENATGTFKSTEVHVYYYYENDAEYKIHYLYGGVEDLDAMVEGVATVGDVISTVEPKDKEGYSFRETINLPLTVTKNRRGGNDIYVMYDKNEYEYKIKYYYEDVNGNYVENTEAEVTASAPYGSEISDYDEKCPEGFTFKRAVVWDGTRAEKELPLVIDSDETKNNIKVYYDRNEYNYTVHYFYDGVENAQMMQTASAKYESEVSNYTDKSIDGYRVDRAKALNDQGEEIDLPLIIKLDETKNVINVYYVKDNFGYSIEYYYDNVKDADKTVTGTAEFASTINTYEDKVIDGYKLDREENKPMTITSNAANNVMKVYYVKDNFGYSIEYYYDNVKDADKTVSGTAEFASTIDTYEDKNIDGYKLDREENKPLTITSNAANNVMKVYYVKDNFGYSIEYYYDNVKDDSKTVTGTAEFASTIDTYEDKNIDGYKLDREENKPMTITSNAANNVMKVYYIKDSFGYSIEYYYDNVKDADKTVTGTAEFGSTINTYEDKVIDGYKLDREENKPMTITSNTTNNVMKVYYVKDNFGYSIEYYYDNVKDADKTVTGTAEFGSTINTYEDKVIDGYKLDREENKPMTITSSAANNIMKVYYVKDNFGYSIEYYYDNIKDDTKTVTGTAEFASTIDTYEDKNIDGYKLDREENKPMTITSNTANNVMKVFYVKDNFGYSIEYYYDNVKDDSKTVSGTAEFASTIDTYEDKNIDGYRLDKTENKPLTITQNAEDNVMKVFYVKDIFGYSVEYYYDNVKDESKTVTARAVFGSTVDTYTDKNIDGYKLDREENKPLTITSNAANNVMKVYYVKDNFAYSVEYYYGGVIDDSKTVTGTAEFGSTVSNYDAKPIDGYKFSTAKALDDNGVEGDLPLTIKSDVNKNKIRVYYVKDNFGYSIEYYYDNVKDDSKTVTGTAEFGSTINNYEDKNIDGYKWDRTENKPLTITSNAANNVMKVYYVKDSFGYSIEYYYDNVKNDDKTVTGTALLGTVINEYEDKNIDGYKLDREVNKPMTITSNAENNVMKVYYVKDSFNYEVHYFYENGENTYAEDESKAELTNSAVFGSEISTYTEKLKPGFKYEKARALNAEGTEGEMPLLIKSDESKNKINVYYIKDALGYEIHYFYEDLNGEYQEDTSKQENKNSTIGEEISAYPDKSGEGYELDREKALDENGEETDLPLIIKADATKNIINVYYRRSNFDYTVHYFIDGVENESLVETGNAKFGSSISTYTDKCPSRYELVKARALDENGEETELPLTIKADAAKNKINVYYEKIPEGKVYVEYVDNLTGEKINIDGVDNPTIKIGDIGSNYEINRITIPGYRLDEDNLPTNETGVFKTENQTVTYTYIELRPYELEVRYSAGEDEIDDAKIAVEFGGVDAEGNPIHRIEGYTTNGILKIDDIELTDLGIDTYTVYETETPEYCDTVVSKENPGVVELKATLNTEKNKYEFIPTYEEKEGFKVIIDEVNKKVIIDITTKKEEKYDLAVKKFITNIDGKAITDREPKVTVSNDGKVSYKTNDSIEKTANNQNITYTIRMYNESEVRAKGKRVIEYIPDGLVFVPDNETNTKYGWNMYKVTENGSLVRTENAEEANVVATDYLVGKDIEALHIADDADEEDETKVSSLDVEVLFKVDESRLTSEDRIIENRVQIMPNKNDDNTENDETTEKAYVQYFDLDIEKYIETVKVENNAGTEEKTYGYSIKGELVKIDVKQSLVNSTKITVTYGLAIRNVGEIAGYATEVEDIVPEGFKLVEDGIWRMDGARAVTNSLSETRLEPGDMQTINITFEWKLTESTIGLKSNEAHIAKYENDYDAKDLTDDNRGKQDMLVTIKTGSEAIAVVTIALGFVMVVAAGTAVLKRKIK